MKVQVIDITRVECKYKDKCKDYKDNNIVENFVREKVIGVVLPDTVNFDGLYVTGDVMLQEEFTNRTHFDNWCIEYDKDKRYFSYKSCELFSREE